MREYEIKQEADHNTPTPDHVLVERAWEGDREAFSELVRRHRTKAFYWAHSIAKDAYLAEDIVQDALVRSFLQLGTLAESGRFVPWLRTIVRNQAIVHMRKTDNSSRVRPVSSFQSDCGPSEQVDVCSIDSVVDYMARRYAEGMRPSSEDPAELVARQEILTVIRQLLQSLSPRSRAIFEAYFFRQLSPREIARLFRTTTSNVYNVLSRSKAKLQEERYRMELNRYLQRREREGKAGSAVLKRPNHTTSYTSLGVALYEALQYTEQNHLTLTEVMGLSGQAFRIDMVPDCGPSSTFIFDWGWAVSAAVHHLGYHAKYVGKPNRQAPDPDTLISAMELIHDSIDKGRPVIAWNLTASEFGLIYGYEDARRVLTFRDYANPVKEVPYEKLGRTADCSSRPSARGATWRTAKPGRPNPGRRPSRTMRSGLRRPWNDRPSRRRKRTARTGLRSRLGRI